MAGSRRAEGKSHPSSWFEGEELWTGQSPLAAQSQSSNTIAKKEMPVVASPEWSCRDEHLLRVFPDSSGMLLLRARMCIPTLWGDLKAALQDHPQG